MINQIERHPHDQRDEEIALMKKLGCSARSLGSVCGRVKGDVQRTADLGAGAKVS